MSKERRREAVLRFFLMNWLSTPCVMFLCCFPVATKGTLNSSKVFGLRVESRHSIIPTSTQRHTCTYRWVSLFSSWRRYYESASNLIRSKNGGKKMFLIIYGFLLDSKEFRLLWWLRNSLETFIEAGIKLFQVPLYGLPWSTAYLQEGSNWGPHVWGLQVSKSLESSNVRQCIDLCF